MKFLKNHTYFGHFFFTPNIPYLNKNGRSWTLKNAQLLCKIKIYEYLGIIPWIFLWIILDNYKDYEHSRNIAEYSEKQTKRIITIDYMIQLNSNHWVWVWVGYIQVGYIPNTHTQVPSIFCVFMQKTTSKRGLKF